MDIRVLSKFYYPRGTRAVVVYVYIIYIEQATKLLRIHYQADLGMITLHDPPRPRPHFLPTHPTSYPPHLLHHSTPHLLPAPPSQHLINITSIYRPFYNCLLQIKILKSCLKINLSFVTITRTKTFF